MRPNRAAMTPFGQQNPPVLLKLSVLCKKKQAKTPIIILPQTPDFLEYETIKKYNYISPYRSAYMPLISVM